MPVATTARRLQELQRCDAPHLDMTYGADLVAPSKYSGLDLPYSSLRGPGFERLCFHLLLAFGEKPRFFGESGQAQFGIDLIVSDGERCEVYQCKNVAGYNERDLERDLNKFEREWLDLQPDIIRPTRFILCVPERLTGRDEWERVKANFRERTGVKVEHWDRDMLDDWLQNQPDIVSDMFGDDTAERFCERANWNDGRFRPLQRNSGEEDIERFLDLKETGRLAIPEQTVERFQNILSLGPTVLIEGRSGVGKTIAALALSSATTRRTFYIRIDEDLDEQALFNGVKERCVRETTFIIDDCQHNWRLVERAIYRWNGALRGRDYKLILTAQTAPQGTESYSLGVVALVDELREVDATIEIIPDEGQFQAILAKRGAFWAQASTEQIRHLHILTAGNLAVLDLIIASDVSVGPNDRNIEHIAAPLVEYWFATASPTAPRLQAFAAVAQFDIAIPAQAAWPQPEATEYAKAIRRLIIRFGNQVRGIAPSWRFGHPAEAETMFRALAAVSISSDWRAVATRHIIDYFCSPMVREAKLLTDLGLFIRNRLRLADDTGIKSDVLAAKEFREALSPHFHQCSLFFLSQATSLTREAGEDLPYLQWLVERINRFIAEPKHAAAEDVALLGRALRTVRLVDPSKLLEIETAANILPLLYLIRERGTIFELFGILQYTTLSFAAGLIGALDNQIISTLIDKTIKAERSIGPLSFALRELSSRPLLGESGHSQRKTLESILGVSEFWRLVEGAGDLNHLSYLLDDLSPAFRTVILAQHHAPDQSRWRALMRRGNYYCLARFAKDSLRLLPSVVTKSFLEAARAEIVALSKSSPWASLGKGLAMCNKIEFVPIRILLESAALERINDVDLLQVAVSDFVEAASVLLLTWHHHEQLRFEIASRFWQILPVRKDWPKDDQLLLGGTLLLELACDGFLGQETTARLMQAFAPYLPRDAISKSEARIVSRFLWNMSACWMTSQDHRSESLLTIWDVATQNALFERLESAVQKIRSDEDALDVTVLAGNLAYLAPEQTERVSAMLKGSVFGFRRLINQSEEMSFVLAALSSIGLALIGSPHIALAKKRVGRIMAKAPEYSDRGPVISHLVSYLWRVST